MTAGAEALRRREAAVERREQADDVREAVAEWREASLDSREDSATLREDQLGAMEAALTETAGFRVETQRLNAELRDANEHLVLASLRAQELSEAAQLAHRRQEEFLAMLAHELRGPLAPIGNAIGVLGRHTGGEPALSRVHDILAGQVRQMARLLDDLLDVSRMARGRVVLRKRRIALADVVGDAVEVARSLIDASGPRLTVDLPSESIEVDADAMRLTQVFGNLLHNATKYTPASGAIRVELTGRGESAIVRVSDDGSGIAADMLPHVFELFTQEYQSPERATGGLGIGLTVVRDLVGLHAGTVEARSAGKGCGSEFIVTLPRLSPLMPLQPLTQEGDVVVAPQALVKPQAASRTYRILLIDDSVESSEMLALLLGMDGHEVTVALDGPSGLEMARRTAPQVVVCDIGLPGMDGHSVAEALLEQARGTPPLMIAVTGYGHPEARARSLAVGFRHHLVKPIDIDTLLRLIETEGEGGARPPIDTAPGK